MTTHISCGVCGVEFCLPTGMHEARVRDGRDFYCPNGDRIAYKPSASQRQIAQLEAELRSNAGTFGLLRDRIDELTAQREDLIGALRECPGRCGWRSKRQVPRDPVNMGRGLERVRMDVALHLVEAHGARPMAMAELTERT